jgi:phage shock protein E
MIRRGALPIFLTLMIWSHTNVTANAADISPEEGQQKVKSGALLLDVRTPKEYSEGHDERSLNIPHDQILERLSEVGNDKDREIVVFCKVGGRAERAKEDLKSVGYANVFNVGGYDDWKNAGD